MLLDEPKIAAQFRNLPDLYANHLGCLYQFSVEIRNPFHERSDAWSTRTKLSSYGIECIYLINSIRNMIRECILEYPYISEVVSGKPTSRGTTDIAVASLVEALSITDEP